MQENSMTTTHDREARVSRHFTLPSLSFFLPGNHAEQLSFHPLNVALGPMRCYFHSKEERTVEICSLKVCSKRRKGKGVWKVWMSIASKMGILKIWPLGGKGENRSSFMLVPDSDGGKGKLWGSCLSIAKHSGQKMTFYFVSSPCLAIQMRKTSWIMFLT